MAMVVHKLSTLQRRAILDHLLTLSGEDRRLRFGAAMADAALARYVEGIDFASDKTLGIYGGGLELIGFGHLAINCEGVFAELGLSVTPAQRKHGYGTALLARAVLYARNIGLHTLYMHCLSENLEMIRLARRAGLSVMANRGEADGSLALREPDFGSIASELMHDQIALVDHLFKQELRWTANMAAAGAGIRRAGSL
ncbi:MAG TPA: GNAT family N-acetyltransferase [Burkholderiales bacterium]|nr:GNAT family N-acetyltransferase [Burkholderiales bacterium]